MNEQRYIRCSQRSRNTLDKRGKKLGTRTLLAHNILGEAKDGIGVPNL